MSFSQDFQDDFGPVRMATVEEIRQEKLKRQSRRQARPNRIRSPEIVFDLDPNEDGGVQLKRRSPRPYPEEPKRRKHMLYGRAELLKYLASSEGVKPKSKSPSVAFHETGTTNRGKTGNRKLLLLGQKELIKYLQEEDAKKKAQKKESAKIQGARQEPRKLYLKPMDEATRQMILAEIAAKKRLQERDTSKAQSGDANESIVTKAESLEAPEIAPDLENEEVDLPSDASDLEFVDALENFDAYTASPMNLEEGVHDVSFDVMEEDSGSFENSNDGEKEDESGSFESSYDGEEKEESGSFESSNDGEKDDEIKREDVNDTVRKQNDEHGSETEMGNENENEDEDDDAISDDGDDEDEVDSNEEKFAKADIQPSDEDVERMRKLILSQVNGNAPFRIEDSSLEASYKEIYSILSHTINDSESHTAIVTGAPGSGKTTIVNHALNELQKLNKDAFITISLSGSLHQTEKHAIREIARQLDIKLKRFKDNTGEDTYEQRAISDTFQNILSTLFKLHGPSEEDEELSIRVIFIIDEMENFISNTKQTLLYNLFELTQVSKIPICTVGITLKVTIGDDFEKRVRSRFSQRFIHTVKANSVEAFWDNAKIPLTVAADDFSKFGDINYPAQWNEIIEDLYQSRSGLTRTILKTFYTTKSYRQANHAFAFPISQISTKLPFPKSSDFEVLTKNSKMGVEAVIASLSAAELIAVVAAARWIAKSKAPHVNFKMAHAEYTEMMEAMNTKANVVSSKTSSLDNMALLGIKITKKLYSAKALRDCWRVIYRTGLLFDIISSTEINANNNQNIYKETMLDDSKLLQLDVSLEELSQLISDDNFVKRFTRL